jgi:hypothetical protein
MSSLSIFAFHQQKMMQRSYVSIVMGIAMCIFIFFFVYSWSGVNSYCDGPPYIYATFHDQVSNVQKYSRNGCLLSTAVLLGGPKHALSNHLVEMRSLVFGPQKNQSVLYVADAFTNDSYLNMYGACNSRGERTFIKSVLSTKHNSGINHIYGICFDENENVYVSSQHTDNVMRFYKDSFKPMPHPPLMIRANSPYYKDYAGSFLQFGLPSSHGLDEQGVRDIVRVGDTIWIANEDTRGIHVVHAVTGLVETIIRDVKVPIGLYHHPESETVFVASKGLNTTLLNLGSVFAVSTRTRTVVRHFKSQRMMHPTGMASHGKVLYVAEQKLG